MNPTITHREPRCVTRDGLLYVGVTSAMGRIKAELGEPPDSYGPEILARMHRAEGTACHAACLDWLAFEHKMIPHYTPPVWPAFAHPDEARWHNVMSMALRGFMDFCERFMVEPIGIEQEAFSSTYGLVGHIDLLCFLNWNGRRAKAIVDLKFVTAVQRTHMLQVRCYHRLDGARDAQLGLIYHADRQTGLWQLKQVDLASGLEDVLAVSYAAKLWAWRQSQSKPMMKEELC